MGLGGLLAAQLPVKLFPASSSTSSAHSDMSSQTAESLYQTAKALFYERRFTESAALYEQIIAAFPERIRYYDGLSRVLGAQQKHFEQVELFYTAAQTYPNHPFLQHRTALSLKSLYKGNRKEAIRFANQYQCENLLESASEIMQEAIRLKPHNKGFYLEIKDLTAINDTDDNPVLPENRIAEIQTLTSPYEEQWETTRASRKPKMGNDLDANVEKIKNRKRRSIHAEKERKEQEKAIKKAKKLCWQTALDNSLKNNKTSKVEQYGLAILNENPKDTQTIGRMRNHYRKEQTYDRLVTLNRFLYMKEASLNNAISLATSLAKYGNGQPALQEARGLLSAIAYPNALPSVYVAAYYLASATLFVRDKKAPQARETLMQGLAHFEGEGGRSYTLLESYALTFTSNTNNPNANSLTILKLLAGKTENLNDPVTGYIQKYRQYALEHPLSIPEQLKPLYALAKLQEKSDKKAYAVTLAEIETLKKQMV